MKRLYTAFKIRAKCRRRRGDLESLCLVDSSAMEKRRRMSGGSSISILRARSKNMLKSSGTAKKTTIFRQYLRIDNIRGVEMWDDRITLFGEESAGKICIFEQRF